MPAKAWKTSEKSTNPLTEVTYYAKVKPPFYASCIASIQFPEWEKKTNNNKKIFVSAFKKKGRSLRLHMHFIGVVFFCA